MSTLKQKIKKFLNIPFVISVVKFKISQFNQQLFFSKFISKNDLCFDIGANVGHKTKIFSKIGAKIISVEPQPACVEKLINSYKNNTNVVIIAKGLSSKLGYAELSVCPDRPSITTMSAKWKTSERFSEQDQWNETIKIPTTTLDDLIKEYGVPIFCKIDVEGYEEEVLKGLNQPIPLLSFEFTKEFYDDAVKCLAHLKSLGEIELNCTIENKGHNFLYKNFVPIEKLNNKIKSYNDKLLCGEIYVRFKNT